MSDTKDKMHMVLENPYAENKPSLKNESDKPVEVVTIPIMENKEKGEPLFTDSQLIIDTLNAVDSRVYRTKKRAGETDKVPDLIMLPSSTAHQAAIAFSQDGKKFVVPIKQTVSIRYDKANDRYYYDGVELNVLDLETVREHDLSKIDLWPLRVIYSIIGESLTEAYNSGMMTRRQAIGHSITIRLADLAEVMRSKGNLSKEQAAEMMTKLMTYCHVVGIFYEEGYGRYWECRYPMLVWMGSEAQNNTITVSRMINQHHDVDPTYQRFTSMEISYGKADGSRELNEQIDAYVSSVKNNMCIVNCDVNTDVETILSDLSLYIESFGISPVVIIDYLQIIQPTEINGRVSTDQRLNTDHIIKSLKQFQKEHNLVMMVICSLNRKNYNTTVDLDSFKESGCIEYTADVVWGLNLMLLSDGEFEEKTANSKMGTTKATTETEKRQMLAEAKSAIKRDVMLRAVKNRYGQTSYDVYFEYSESHILFHFQSPFR